ncbi:hypothetical protein LINPERHAP1_LOCUS344, partial [Linum perenne]
MLIPDSSYHSTLHQTLPAVLQVVTSTGVCSCYNEVRPSTKSCILALVNTC